MALYPNLNEELGLAISLLQQDPLYLEDEDCTYSTETKEALAKLLVAPVEELSPKEKWDKLEYETGRLYDELKNSSQNLSIDDHAERMSYFRTATSLLDKIVGLQERAVGLKAIGAFHQTVLDIMEDILDAGQRTEVMQRLEKVVKGGN